MTILRTLAEHIQGLFPPGEHGRERAHWFLLTLQSILVPITVSRTFDHAAKANQLRWPWAQTIVTLGLRTPIRHYVASAHDGLRPPG
jgi:hypothetical protein